MTISLLLILCCSSKLNHFNAGKKKKTKKSNLSDNIQAKIVGEGWRAENFRLDKFPAHVTFILIYLMVLASFAKLRKVDIYLMTSTRFYSKPRRLIMWLPTLKVSVFIRNQFVKAYLWIRAFVHCISHVYQPAVFLYPLEVEWLFFNHNKYCDAVFIYVSGIIRYLLSSTIVVAINVLPSYINNL